jgi:YD repeat-containing protein
MSKIITSLFVIYVASFAYAQQDGIPNFSAADVHQYDTVNLLTLVPTFNFPVISKPGAIPFSVGITSPQNCYVYGSGPGSVWTCNGGDPYNYLAPFLMVPNNMIGMSIQYVQNSNTCIHFNITGLVGPDGITVYPVPLTTIFQNSGCGVTSATVTTTDGSGFTATISVVSGYPGFTSLYSSSGLSGSGLRLINSVSDPFGNAVSTSLGRSGTFTDTLTSNALSYSGGTSYTYTDTTSKSESITLTTGAAQLVYPLGYSTCADPSSVPSINPVTAINYPDGTSIGIGWAPNNTRGGITGLIGSITLRTGATVSYAYGPLSFPTSCTLWEFASLSRTTPDGTTTYTQSINGSTYTTTVLDPGQNKAVYTFQGTIITEIQKYQNTGTVASPVYSLLTTDVYCYNNNQTNCPSTSPNAAITQRDVYHYTGPTQLAMSRSTSKYDSYGNVTYSAVYDYVTGQTRGRSTTFGSWNGSQCTAIGSHINNRPCDVVTTDGTNNLSESRFTYNSQGFLATKTVWTGSAWLTTNYAPNSNGTAASVTDPNGQVTSLGYAATGSGGCNGVLETSMSTTVNGGVISSSKTWDCNGGVTLTTTDPNGNGTSTQYDAIFRQMSFKDPSNYTTTTNYTSTSALESASFGSSVQNHEKYLDSLGRPIISQTQQGSGSSNYDTVSKQYSFNGPNSQTRVSSPCVQTSDQPCSTYNTSLVDPLGRTISTTDALGGTVTNTYNQNDVLSVLGPAPPGENVKSTQTEYDGLQRTKSVCQVMTSGGTSCGQNTAASGYVTTYAYSSFSGGTKTTLTRGAQTRTFVYDALGRMTSETHPEKGTITYTYDSVNSGSCNVSSPGDLVLNVDNAGNGTCYQYDGLHRVMSDGGWRSDDKRESETG